MPVTFSARINGARELDKALQELPKDLAKTALRNAVRAGAAELMKAARNAAPVRSGGGLKAIKPRLTRAATKRIARRLGRSTTGSVQLTRAEVRQLAPQGAASGAMRGPGFLKRSIKVYGVRLTRAGVMSARVGVGAAFYGGFLESGTRKMAPRPWFGAAVQGAAQNAVQAMGARLRVELDKAARKYAVRRGAR